MYWASMLTEHSKEEALIRDLEIHHSEWWMLTCPALWVLRIQTRQEPGTVTKDFREQWFLTQAPKTRWGTPKPKGRGLVWQRGVYVNEGGNNSQQTQWHSTSQRSYSWLSDGKMMWYATIYNFAEVQIGIPQVNSQSTVQVLDVLTSKFYLL